MRKRADILLVERGLFESRNRAREAIEAGLVTAGNALVRKPSEGLDEDVPISASPAHPYVSRAGTKLAFALDRFALPVTGRVALDIGASTGGFSEVLLQRGARRVYAVDIGRGQLHASLRDEPRLVSLEATDARALDGLIAEPVDIVTIDVSFISSTRILSPVLAFTAAEVDVILLVKPQFEAGRDKLGKGGIVRDPAVHDEVCQRVSAHVAGLGLRIAGLVPSPIAGADGNREFLIVARRNAS